MLFKAILIFTLGVLVGVFIFRSGRIGTKTAIILSLGFVGSTYIYQYYSSYQSCVRGFIETGGDSNVAQVECAKLLGTATVK